MTTTWQILIDWDRDGDFTTTGDDVTAYVQSAQWFLGAKRPYRDTAILQQLALNIIKKPDLKESIRRRRKKAALNTTYLEKILDHV